MPVADNILDKLYVDGQRGLPYLFQRLLLLNVVGFRPLIIAKREHDMPWRCAQLSIAHHISICVIFCPLFL
jgi:hypothetical protein